MNPRGVPRGVSTQESPFPRPFLGFYPSEDSSTPQPKHNQPSPKTRPHLAHSMLMSLLMYGHELRL